MKSTSGSLIDESRIGEMQKANIIEDLVESTPVVNCRIYELNLLSSCNNQIGNQIE